MYYPLNDVKSLATVLVKLGYVYKRPSTTEIGTWYGKSLKVVRSFLDTVVFEKNLDVSTQALFGYLYDLGIYIPVLVVNRSLFLADDVYDVLLIGEKFNSLVIPYLLVAYNRAFLKVKSYEVDSSVWTNSLYNEPLFVVLPDGFYIDWEKTDIGDTVVPTDNAPLVFNKKVTVKVEEVLPQGPEPSTPESPSPSSSPDSKPLIWEDEEFVISIATLFIVFLIIMLCQALSKAMARS